MMRQSVDSLQAVSGLTTYVRMYSVGGVGLLRADDNITSCHRNVSVSHISLTTASSFTLTRRYVPNCHCMQIKEIITMLQVACSRMPA